MQVLCTAFVESEGVNKAKVWLKGEEVVDGEDHVHDSSQGVGLEDAAC